MPKPLLVEYLTSYIEQALTKAPRKPRRQSSCPRSGLKESDPLTRNQNPSRHPDSSLWQNHCPPSAAKLYFLPIPLLIWATLLRSTPFPG